MKRIIILAFTMLTISQAHAELIFYESFDIDLSQLGNGATSDACCDYSIRITDDKTRSGPGAMGVEHRLSDPVIHNGHRAEVSFSEAFSLLPSGEYWFGFSTYIPDDYVLESKSANWTVVWQIHGRPDFDQGENWRSPPLALDINATGWQVAIRSDPQKVSTSDSITSVYETLPMVRGQWTDWAFHVNWSWSSDGFVDVYCNGELVYRYTGPSYYNDQNGGYMKMGIYRAETSDVFVRTLYHDEVRVGDAASNLSEVSSVSPADVPPRPPENLRVDVD